MHCSNIFTRTTVLVIMADYSLDIAEFLKRSGSLPVIDVRSQAEYQHAHIPGAVNLPLFSNEERSIIGTLYLQKGSSEAISKGLEFIRPRMNAYASSGYDIAPGGESLMHCWRGGMRSNSMAWLFNTVGIKTFTLSGGYKNYRRHVLNSFQKAFDLVVIGGMTGSGKTAVIEALESLGEQVVHLERLANHKGSVFGGIGMPDQPSTEQFENDLSARLMMFNTERPVFIEDESPAIGKVFIPRDFCRQITAAPLINLVVPVNRRIEHLVETYATGNPELIIAGVKRLERRLGLEHAGRIIHSITAGDMNEAVGLILRYYDKVYARSMGMHQRKSTYEMSITNESADEIAIKIKEQRLKIKDN